MDIHIEPKGFHKRHSTLRRALDPKSYDRILWFEQNQPNRSIEGHNEWGASCQPFLSSATCTLKSALFLKPEVGNVPGGSIRNTLEPPGGNIPTELNSSGTVYKHQH